jgi:hypothetical protein
MAARDAVAPLFKQQDFIPFVVSVACHRLPSVPQATVSPKTAPRSLASQATAHLNRARTKSLRLTPNSAAVASISVNSDGDMRNVIRIAADMCSFPV